MISVEFSTAFAMWHRVRFSRSNHRLILWTCEHRAARWIAVFRGLATATPLLLAWCKRLCWNEKEPLKAMRRKRRQNVDAKQWRERHLCVQHYGAAALSRASTLRSPWSRKGGSKRIVGTYRMLVCAFSIRVIS